MTSNFHHITLSPFKKIDTVKELIMKYILLSFSIVLFGCGGRDDSSEGRSIFTGEYKDGTYCADVSYHNPNTGTSNTYTLNVEVENNELVKINWPNGGWLDDSHFSPQELDENGYCSFESDKGYEYTVQITGSECSFDDRSKAASDSDDEKDAITCPKCGNEKDSYDRYCDDCTDKIENTCSRCGGHEYNVNGGLCYSCKRKEEDEEEEREREENVNNE
jgi:ribosomal protein L37E